MDPSIQLPSWLLQIIKKKTIKNYTLNECKSFFSSSFLIEPTHHFILLFHDQKNKQKKIYWIHFHEKIQIHQQTYLLFQLNSNPLQIESTFQKIKKNHLPLFDNIPFIRLCYYVSFEHEKIIRLQNLIPILKFRIITLEKCKLQYQSNLVFLKYLEEQIQPTQKQKKQFSLKHFQTRKEKIISQIEHLLIQYQNHSIPLFPIFLQELHSLLLSHTITKHGNE
jgi:hypothetical protein